MNVAITLCDMATAYGLGTEECWEGILSKKTAIAKISRFDTGKFNSSYAAVFEGLSYHQQDSLVWQMIKALLSKHIALIPKDTKLILASAKGEIDLLEKELLNGRIVEANQFSLNKLAEKISGFFGIAEKGMVISAACISSGAAVSRGSAMIRRGECDCVLVVAAEGVNEFVFSGFSSLMAIDKSPASPFDKNRNGLCLGEAAAFVLLMSRERAKKEGREISGEISGWGLSSDANHMTGPSRDGGGQISAITQALKTARIDSGSVDIISAHGTGTIYNDAMEMKAFKAVFENKPKPVYSIKGAIGHTMGAAGLVEMLIALQCLKSGIVPPVVNLKNPDEDAKDWVSCEPRFLACKTALVSNSGFGGVNSALILSRPPLGEA